ELARLEAAADRIVEVEEARGDAGRPLRRSVLECLLDLLQGRRDERGKGDELAATFQARRGDPREELLRPFQDGAGFEAVRVAHQVDHMRGGARYTPQRRAVAHDASVVRDVGR